MCLSTTNTCRRILFAWQNTGVPVDEVMNDILRAFHHPAVRNEQVEIQRNMFNTVRRWVDEHPNRGMLNQVLGSQSVKAGKNHKEDPTTHSGHTHNTFQSMGITPQNIWNKIQSRDLNEMTDGDGMSRGMSPFASSSPSHSPNTFGYTNSQFAAPQQQQGPDASYLRPESQGYGGPGGYQQTPPPMDYQSYGPPPGQYQDPYQQMPPGPGGYYPPQGTPQGGPGWGGPPPPMMGGPPPPMSQPYPQQPPYGYGPPPPNQYPGQGYPGQGYPGPGYGGGY